MTGKSGQADAFIIAITPDMVIAGANELLGRDGGDDPVEVCQDVFGAMLEAAELQKSTSRLTVAAVESRRLALRRQAAQKELPQGASSVLFSSDDLVSAATGRLS